MSHRAYRPCPLGVRGESERPEVFGSFFLKKNNLFPKDLGEMSQPDVLVKFAYFQLAQ
jgi:hypothetical protein